MANWKQQKRWPNVPGEGGRVWLARATCKLYSLCWAWLKCSRSAVVTMKLSHFSTSSRQWIEEELAKDHEVTLGTLSFLAGILPEQCIYNERAAACFEFLLGLLKTWPENQLQPKILRSFTSNVSKRCQKRKRRQERENENRGQDGIKWKEYME